MKAHYRAAGGRLTFEVQGETPKELFAQIAALQDVFDAENVCGICGSSEIRFQHRHVEDFDYYELQCMAGECRGRFQFGQHKKGGGLFPKRKDDDGHFLPNRGWARYIPPGPARASNQG